MNFKMKALVAAAVAVMSVSGAANAAIDNAAAGNSSVILTVFDRANNVSAVFDLGFHYETFAFGGSQSASSSSWNLASGDYADAWNSFLSVASLDNITWGVVAGDNTGSAAQLASKGFITTFNTTLNNNAPDGTGFVFAQHSSPLAGLNDYINANNNLATTVKLKTVAALPLLARLMPVMFITVTRYGAWALLPWTSWVQSKVLCST